MASEPVSDKLYGLTQRDRDVLAALVREYVREVVNVPSRSDNVVDHEETPAPEVYVAWTPFAGIAGRSGSVPGSELCDIYHAVPDGVTLTGRRLVAIPGLQKRIHNLSEEGIAGNEFVLAKRDKSGVWWATGSADPDEEVGETGTGTGTGTGTRDTECLTSFTTYRPACNNGCVGYYAQTHSVVLDDLGRVCIEHGDEGPFVGLDCVNDLTNCGDTGTGTPPDPLDFATLFCTESVTGVDLYFFSNDCPGLDGMIVHMVYSPPVGWIGPDGGGTIEGGSSDCQMLQDCNLLCDGSLDLNWPSSEEQVVGNPRYPDDLSDDPPTATWNIQVFDGGVAGANQCCPFPGPHNVTVIAIANS